MDTKEGQKDRQTGPWTDRNRRTKGWIDTDIDKDIGET